MEGAELIWCVFSKEGDAQYGIEVQKDEEQYPNPSNVPNASYKDVNEKLEFWEGSEHTEYSQNSHKAEYGNKASSREHGQEEEKAEEHNNEVKDVPAVLKVLPGFASICTHAYHNLDGEQSYNHEVEESQSFSVRRFDSGVHPNAHEERGKEDDPGEKVLEQTCSRCFLAPCGEFHRNLPPDGRLELMLH